MRATRRRLTAARLLPACLLLATQALQGTPPAAAMHETPALAFRQALPVTAPALVPAMAQTAAAATAAALALAAAPARAAVPAPPACLGAHDLLVDHGAPQLSGGTYDRICIVHGSTVQVASGSVLRAGLLYIDAGSSLSSDGMPGGRPTTTDCAGFGNGTPTGDAGGTITILAHAAVVLGKISAAGGAGSNGHETPCADYVDPGGNGGVGGTIVVKAVDLTLQGPVAAPGGDGGPGQPAGHGAAGGSITIRAQNAAAATWTPLLTVVGGKNPAGGTAASGFIAPIAALGPADLALLPPAAPPLTQRLGTAPAQLPLQTNTAFAAGMQCGAGDLLIAPGASLHLHGVHTYAHVCLQGTLQVDGSLTLLAQTIQVAATASIRATGVIAQTAPVSPTDACAASHVLPQRGYAGQAGQDSFGGPGGKGGKGGGAITLVATRMLFAGSAAADGVQGGNGVDGGNGSPTSGDIPPSDGGQGGMGGGISLVAGDLQLTGKLSTRGGPGGRAGTPINAPSPYSAPFALPGAGGCVRIIATTLRAPSSALTIAGTLYYGRRGPLDPVLPPASASIHYSSTTLHTLSGAFLAFWQQHNGLPLFGEPISQQYVEQGQAVQYFERSRLVLKGGAVAISPLGTLLTAGQSFPPAAPSANTAVSRYFPETHHSLSGRFLRYWLSHDGAALFGPPISEPFSAPNGDGTGRRYLIQYFRNARMEYHPELKNPKYEVSLGALGREYLAQQNAAR